MSQVNKAIEILTFHNAEVDKQKSLEGLMHTNEVTAKTLLSIVLEAFPNAKNASDFLDVPYTTASKSARDMANGMRDGHNSALDEAEQAIRKVFGVQNEQVH